MQDEDKELSNLNPETVQRAIEAVKSKAWDVNPFTVADELKVSRAAVYRQADIMKQIIVARGGSFGMDVQTSLDLAWQLRQLELQNNELKEKLAHGEPLKIDPPSSGFAPLKATAAISQIKEADKSINAGDEIYNLASYGPRMSNYLDRLPSLSWKDIETVYYFKVSSLRDHANNLFKTDRQNSSKINGENSPDLVEMDKNSISYGSLVSIEASKRNSQSSLPSISPFARLKAGSLNSKKSPPEMETEPLIEEKPNENSSEEITGDHDIISVPQASSIISHSIDGALHTGFPFTTDNQALSVQIPLSPQEKFSQPLPTSSQTTSTNLPAIEKPKTQITSTNLPAIQSSITALGASASQAPATAKAKNQEEIYSPMSNLEALPITEIEKEKTKKQIEKLETDLMRLASQLQNDLAEHVRSDFGAQFEPSPTSSESNWLSFDSQLQSLGTEAILPEQTEATAQSKVTELAASQISTPIIPDSMMEVGAAIDKGAQPTPNEPIEEIKIEKEIKLITFRKEGPLPHDPNVVLIISDNIETVKFSQTDNEEKNSLIKKETPLLPEEPPGQRDELRDLIQSHIRNAAEQMAEVSHSIGSGKEFETWLNNPARSKFVGSTKEGNNEDGEEEAKVPLKSSTFKPRVVPPEVRKACLILGVRPDNITYEGTQEAWKKAIASPGVHPDLGGDTELAVYLNTAKDVIMRFLDAQAPKLGKKFGPKKEKDGKTKSDKPKGEQ